MAEIIEVSHYNLHKHKEVVSGDTFLLDRAADDRLVATLADGLGSGVKANVLSQLTACMAQKFMLADVESTHAAQTIMETLPVCSKRGISYSTLTTLNISPEGWVKILEYDNPELLWVRDGQFLERERVAALIKTTHRRNQIFYSELQLRFGDRLVFFSDGVTQSGMGSSTCPLGWREENVKIFITNLLEEQPSISGKELARKIVEEARRLDRTTPKDDISCAVVYYRKSRNTLLLTGPPSQREKCPYLVETFKKFKGRKIVSGGTTSQIIAEGIGEVLTVDIKDIHSGVPPRSIMKGADLVTEGMLTINKTINLLKDDSTDPTLGKSAAHRMVQILLESDHLHFLIGTAINEAHQNPNMTGEMGLRRIAMNELANILRKKFIKKVTIEYV